VKKSVQKYLAKIGAKGGASGTGSAKARPSHIARRATKIRETLRHLKPGHRICPICGGTGHNDFYDHIPCAACRSTGQVRDQDQQANN
jgi:DnaJ-class molecular chaperone